MVFEKQKQITLENQTEQFTGIAKEIGFDTDKFGQCLKLPEAAARVQNEIQEAQSVRFIVPHSRSLVGAFVVTLVRSAYRTNNHHSNLIRLKVLKPS